MKRAFEKKAREQAKEKWRKGMPYLNKRMGLALMFHVGKATIAKSVIGIIFPILIFRFFLRRLLEARNYIQERREDKRQAAENRRQALINEKQAKEEAARQEAENVARSHNFFSQYEAVLRELRDF